MPSRLRLLVVGFALAMAACQPSSSPSNAPSPDASSAALPAADDPCHPIDLRTPNGDAVDLNGRWRSGNDGRYYLAQDRSCVFWMGQSAGDGDLPAGAYWTNVFSGQIGQDLTVVGPWSDVPAQPNAAANHGQLQLGITFFTQDGVTWPALGQLSQEPPGVYGDYVWQPEASLLEPAEYVGTIGIDHQFCPWVEVHGERYELVGPTVAVEGDHVFAPGAVRGIAVGERVLLQAQIAQALTGWGCQSSAMLLTNMELVP